jgi:hypothetical protein
MKGKKMPHPTTRNILAGIAAYGLSVSFAQAGLINLVHNGEFDRTGAQPSTWAPIADVAHWYSTEGKIEIWAESFQWGSDLGSDGLATGQHAEITWKTDKASISTSFVIPEVFADGSTALFSFDFQNRASSGVLGSVMVNGNEAASFSGSSPGSWAAINLDIAGLSAGDNVELLFRSKGGGSSGAHIDQVAFLIDSQRPSLLRVREVPTPATFALLGLGLAGLGWTGARPKHQSSNHSGRL